VDATQDWPQLSLEEVVQLQPEYLVIAAQHADSTPTDLDNLAARPGWRSLDAVRNKKFAVVSDAVNRPAPRIVSAIEDLARQLHPEAFQEKPSSTPEDVKPTAPGAEMYRDSIVRTCKPNGSDSLAKVEERPCNH
jgi:hypothetical protein